MLFWPLQCAETPLFSGQKTQPGVRLRGSGEEFRAGAFAVRWRRRLRRELVGKPHGGTGTIFSAYAGEYRVALQERLPAGGVFGVQRAIARNRVDRAGGGIADPIAFLRLQRPNKGGVAVDEGDLRMRGKEPR